MTVGYTSCPCRDCFEISMDNDPCSECEESGCSLGDNECDSPHAYGQECGRENCCGNGSENE